MESCRSLWVPGHLPLQGWNVGSCWYGRISAPVSTPFSSGSRSRWEGAGDISISGSAPLGWSRRFGWKHEREWGARRWVAFQLESELVSEAEVFQVYYRQRLVVLDLLLRLPLSRDVSSSKLTEALPITFLRHVLTDWTSLSKILPPPSCSFCNVRPFQRNTSMAQAPW